MISVTQLRLCLLSAAISLACLTACSHSGQPAGSQTPAVTDVADSNPASGNLAPVASGTAPTEPVSSTLSGTPPEQSAPAQYDDTDLPANDQQYPADYAYDTTTPIQTTAPPPPLPDYSQPPCPGDGYYWTPGYWAWANSGYYWVPGAWVVAPWVDALWTPPYWGFDNGYYQWHPGYWGTHIGFYGGINYGFGYSGTGFYGAYWNHDRLFYNRNVTNIDPNRVHNVYNYGAPRGGDDHASYNGGRGGISARPGPQELAVVRDPRTPPVAAQVQHAREAASNRAQFAARGKARPATLAAATPLHTNYQAPAAKPPAAALRAAQAHPAQQHEATAHPATPERPTPQHEAAAQPQAHPAPQHEATAHTVTPERPVAPQHEAARPEARPATPERPAPQRAATRPEAHPAPPARPAPERATAPRPKPAPHVEVSRSAPPAHPEAPARHAAPARSAPPARPVPPARRAEPARRAAPAKPAPPAKPDDKKP